MSEKQNIIFQVDIENSEFKKGANEITADLNSIGKSVKGVDTSSIGASKNVAQLGAGFNLASLAIKGFVGFQVASKLYDIGKASLVASGRMEQYTVAFTTMLGSAEKAKTLLADMTDFASSTPFELTEVVDAGKKLIAFGFSAESIVPTLTKLGDIASGIGIPVGDLSAIFGKVSISGRVMNDDLMQMSERGIPVINELAKVMNVSKDSIRGLAEKGKISFSDLQNAFTNMTKEGSQFGGMMDKQAETLNGKWSNFNDELGKTAVIIGDNLAGPAKDLISIATILINKFNEPVGKADSITMTGSIIKDINNMLNGTAEKVETIGARLGDVKVREILDDVRKWEASSTGVSAKVKELQDKYGEVNASAGIYSEYVKGHVKLTGDQVEQLEKILKLTSTLTSLSDPFGIKTSSGSVRDILKNYQEKYGVKTTPDKSGKGKGSDKPAAKTDMKPFYALMDNPEEAVNRAEATELANIEKANVDKLFKVGEYEKAKTGLTEKYSKIREEAEAKSLETMFAKYSQFTSGLTSLSGGLSEVLSMNTANQTANIDNESQEQLEIVNTRYQSEVDAINNSAMTAEQKATQLKTLDEKKARDDKKIQDDATKEKKKLAREAAEMQKKIAIFETSVTIPQAAFQAWKSAQVLPFPASAVVGGVMAATATGLGLAKLKMIQEQPLPSYAVGTWGVPYDMTANIHKDEMIIPKTFADSVRSGEASVGGGSGGGMTIIVQGSVIDAQGLLEIVDDMQEKRASNMGATKYSMRSAY